MSKFVLLLALIFYTTELKAESLHYQIYGIDETGNAAVITKGVRNYTDAEVRVNERLFRGRIHWEKSLVLEDGFTIGASVYREPEVTGFGIWARRSDRGFSWEWFDAAAPSKFTKLQESGQLSIAYHNVGSLKEISEITFDTDVSLRLYEPRSSKRATHRIVIKAGSVLKFPANNGPDRTRALGVLRAFASS